MYYFNGTLRIHLRHSLISSMQPNMMIQRCNQALKLATKPWNKLISY